MLDHLAVGLDLQRHAVGVEGGAADSSRLHHVHALLAGVLEQDRVELAALHVVRPLRPRHALQEVERRADLALLIVKRRAVLDLKAAALDGLERGRRRSSSMVAGTSDSPTLKRGKTSRSKTATLRPPRARWLATVEPPGPPPTTTTSCVATTVMGLRAAARTPGTCGR